MRAERGDARALGEATLAGVLFFALAAGLLYPLFSDPAHSVLDPRGVDWLYGWHRPWNAVAQGEALLRDLKLAIWVYGAGWRGLVEHPLALFDAGIFHPAPASLAYSEHALGKQVLFGPIFGLTGNPVLAYQLDLWLCFGLSGAAMFALVRHFGAGPGAALLAGFIYAFCPARIEMVHYSHLMTGQWLPLALLFLDRTMLRGRLSDALVAAGFLAVHFLTSVYLAYVGLTVVLAWAAAGVLAGSPRPGPRGLGLAALALGLALIPFALAAMPYLDVRATGTLHDFRLAPAALVGVSLHPWRGLLLPPAFVQGANARLGQGAYAYLGVLPLVLAALALPVLRRPKSPEVYRGVAIGLAIAILSWILALGPEVSIGSRAITMPYWLAMEWVPGFSSMRVPSRFVLGLVAGFALLVGLGAERLLAAARRAHWPAALRGAAVVALALLVMVDFGTARRTWPLHRVPVGAERGRVYAALENQPAGPLLEVPFAGRGGRHAIDAMLAAVSHGRPLLNGTSGYAPPSQSMVSDLVATLPAAASLTLLRRMTGLRWIIVHEELLEPDERARWQHPAGLREVERDHDSVLYELEPGAGPADLLPALRECARSGRGCGFSEADRILLPGADRNGDGRIVIACLGDSNTDAGWQHEQDPTFPRDRGWCERLPEALGAASVEIVNLAVPGASAVQQPMPSVEEAQVHFDGDRQLAAVLAASAPDIVLISFVTNDAHPRRARELGRSLTAEEVVGVHRELLARAESAGVLPLVATAPRPRAPGHGSRSYRLEGLVVAINDGLREAVPEERLIDFAAAVVPADYLDDIHMNSAAHERRARLAAQKIRALLPAGAPVARAAGGPPAAANALPVDAASESARRHAQTASGKSGAVAGRPGELNSGRVRPAAQNP